MEYSLISIVKLVSFISSPNDVDDEDADSVKVVLEMDGDEVWEEEEEAEDLRAGVREEEEEMEEAEASDCRLSLLTASPSGHLMTSMICFLPMDRTSVPVDSPMETRFILLTS